MDCSDARDRGIVGECDSSCSWTLHGESPAVPPVPLQEKQVVWTHKSLRQSNVRGRVINHAPSGKRNHHLCALGIQTFTFIHTFRQRNTKRFIQCEWEHETTENIVLKKSWSSSHMGNHCLHFSIYSISQNLFTIGQQRHIRFLFHLSSWSLSQETHGTRQGVPWTWCQPITGHDHTNTCSHWFWLQTV